MPVNHSQGKTTRWYQLCFIPTSSDDSDDSDIESVVLTPSNPTQTSSTWQELSPPLPPDSEPEIDMSFSLPPPPPLPDFLQPRPLQRALARTFNIEVQQDRHQPPSPSHVFEGDQSDCSMNVMNGISRVRVSEIDKLFECLICMEEFKVGGEEACWLPCTHTFCSECILRWLNNSKTCPVCRLPLNGCSFDSINCNNGLDSPQFLSPSPRLPIVHDSPQRWENFSESPPYLLPGIENSINDINGLDSPPEILPPPPVHFHGSPWAYFFESPPYVIAQDIENSESGNTDEADYDSAWDELGDPHEDGASQSVPAPLT